MKQSQGHGCLENAPRNWGNSPTPSHSKGWSRGFFFGDSHRPPQRIPSIIFPVSWLLNFLERPKNERGTPKKKWRFGFRSMAIFSWTPWHPPPRATLPCALARSNSFCQTSHLWKPVDCGSVLGMVVLTVPTLSENQVDSFHHHVVMFFLWSKEGVPNL